MPTINQTYVCEECFNKYITIKAKRGAWHEFLHNALNQITIPTVKYESSKELNDKIVKAWEKPIKTPKDVRIKDLGVSNVGGREWHNEVIITPKDAEKAVIGSPGEALLAYEKGYKGKLCKIHGTPLDDRGKCLVKGCKYG